MVEFRHTMSGYEVRVDDQPFGYIDKDGFFTDPTVVKNFMRVSSADLREIANKVDIHRADNFVRMSLVEFKRLVHRYEFGKEAHSHAKRGEAGP